MKVMSGEKHKNADKKCSKPLKSKTPDQKSTKNIKASTNSDKKLLFNKENVPSESTDECLMLEQMLKSQSFKHSNKIQINRNDRKSVIKSTVKTIKKEMTDQTTNNNVVVYGIGNSIEKCILVSERIKNELNDNEKSCGGPLLITTHSILCKSPTIKLSEDKNKYLPAIIISLSRKKINDVCEDVMMKEDEEMTFFIDTVGKSL